MRRVEILWKEAKARGCDYITDQQIADAIHDAEFDTLNFPSTIAARHGLPFTWRKEVAIDKIALHEDSIEREEYFDQIINELNE